MKMVKNVVFFVQSILCETKLSLYKTKRQFMSFTNIWTSRFQNIRPLYIGPLSTISTCVPLKSDFFIIHMCFLKKFHISVFKENRTVIRTGQKVCRSLQPQFSKNAIIFLPNLQKQIKFYCMYYFTKDTACGIVDQVIRIFIIGCGSQVDNCEVGSCFLCLYRQIGCRLYLQG